MGWLYRKPLRVYLLLGAFGLWGIWSGLSLSTSLFPMSSQTTVAVNISYGSYSPNQFYESVGKGLESILQRQKAGGVPVDHLKAEYENKSASFRLKFGWGADPDLARTTVETQVKAYVSRFEDRIRNSASVYSWRGNQGFYAQSFYSPLRSLDEVYRVMDPFVRPISSLVQDAEEIELYNPNGKEITVMIQPERLAQFGLTTRDVESAINDSIFALNGGALRVGEREYQIRMPKKAPSTERLANIRVSPASQRVVLLKDIATVSVAVSESSNQSFKTSGVESLILFGSPKEGGNVKRMSDDISAALAATRSQWPADIETRVLVNPADFIDKSIQGVLHEVGLAAFLAVLVLFVFIGSFRNVITAAIEIPLSLTMAFILMKLSGMNLNLISLGGLALSAGMNVDASVVVMENIFRHFDGKGKALSYEEKWRTVVAAVNEVKMPIIASTIASLVVFLPLIFTRGLTNALLGDLAKAVIFSHGLSAIVALVLVPTIRLHLLSRGEMHHGHSPFEGALARLDRFYERTLRAFLVSARAQITVFALVLLTLPALLFLVVPTLKKEVIGTPESDWLMVGINSPLITKPKQMESELEVLEQALFQQFPDEILYTFSQVYRNGGNVMMRLKNRGRVEDLQNKVEETFKNTPTKSYWVHRWNPSELRIPEPPQYRLEISGGTPLRRQQVAHDLREILSDPAIFDNVNAEPSTLVEKGLLVSPLLNFSNQPEVLSRFDLSHYLRVATEGITVDTISDGTDSWPIYLRMPESRASSIENLAALPVGFDGRLIPLGALAHFSIEEKEPPVYRENLQAMSTLEGGLKKNNLSLAPARKALAVKAVAEYQAKLDGQSPEQKRDNPLVLEVVPDKELQQAFGELKAAILISILLIFLVMVLQLGDVVSSLLVLLAIPLGIIGVIASLAIFGSSLSLNSGLGTILLNGIAVANSIILVDFIRRSFASGMSAYDATVFASVSRLRPILMTSLCTVLGMMPIALGMGEGGKTLQPLGIAVSGGLWVSTLLTLYLVPCLQFQYLRVRGRNHSTQRAVEVSV